MADASRRHPDNVAGDLFVDATCIDCGTCRWMAPEVFDARGGASRVYAQPVNPSERDRALAAIVACPTGSIGSLDRGPLGAVIRSFPRQVDGDVYHCGFHAEASFGAAAWFARRPDGNVLVDSPRYNAHLVRALEAMGGVRWMFLTHRDDVADHERWAERFGATRVMHRGDRTRGTAGVELRIDGDEPHALAPGLTVIPTPGHTRGSAVLHLDDRVLFTGDTLAGRAGGGLKAFRSACWYDWDVLRGSLERLRSLRFSWVLPGHGAPWQADPDAMQAALADCIDRM